MFELRTWLLCIAQETIMREKNEDAAHDYEHLIRVMSFAEHIQRHEGGNLAAVWAAVVFHDIGQERERCYGGDHAYISAEIARELLVNTDFPQDSIAIVLQAIQEHRMTGGKIPSTIEGRILYDADKIDILGAIGIGRLFYISGRRNQKLYSILPDNMRHGIDYAQVRLLRQNCAYSPNVEFQLLFHDLPSRLMTGTGRKLAQERYDYMVKFFDRLQKEIAGLL